MRRIVERDKVNVYTFVLRDLWEIDQLSNFLFHFYDIDGSKVSSWNHSKNYQGKDNE